MEALYPFHPRLVHFAVALSLAGVGFLVAGLARSRPRWVEYGRLNLLLGWVGVLVAMASGLVDQARAPASDVVAATINLHITTGIALFVALGLAVYWPLRRKALLAERNGRLSYLALLVLVAGLVLLEGWLGGKLVYTLGVGVAR